MAIQVQTLSDYLYSLLSPDAFSIDGCINGMQVEGSNNPISHITTAVTASKYVIEKAVDLKSNFLIVHHGLFLKLQSVAVTKTLKEKLVYLLSNGIHLYCYHLPLDAHQEYGNNWPVAKTLGLVDTLPFGKYQNVYIGVQGRIETPISFDELYDRLTSIYKCQGLHINARKKPIQNIAIVSGNAHRFFQEAIDKKIDCFISGTHDEPIWHMAHEEKCDFFSFGHASTEKIGVQLLGEHLARTFKIKHSFIDEMNPF